MPYCAHKHEGVLGREIDPSSLSSHIDTQLAPLSASASQFHVLTTFLLVPPRLEETSTRATVNGFHLLASFRLGIRYMLGRDGRKGNFLHVSWS